ncbi:nuclear transport factor 2 family protein [Psychrobacter faecalis]|uniref:nuclear transport factor 2 family protein n=1 Tax=Psychrobacter faecalis TaxID=180588 RepID=UPI003FD630EB
MSINEVIIKELYASAESETLNPEEFASFFAKDGYFLDMATGEKWVGADVCQPIEGLASIFPDMHRELLKIYSTASDEVVVELRLQGTRSCDLPTPSGIIPASGKAFDVPCCDVFQLANGKVKAFHCYNMNSIFLEQLSA